MYVCLQVYAHVLVCVYMYEDRSALLLLWAALDSNNPEGVCMYVCMCTCTCVCVHVLLAAALGCPRLK